MAISLFYAKPFLWINYVWAVYICDDQSGDSGVEDVSSSVRTFNGNLKLLYLHTLVTLLNSKGQVGVTVMNALNLDFNDTSLYAINILIKYLGYFITWPSGYRSDVHRCRVYIGTIIYRSVKFKFNDRYQWYHCIRKTILNGDDLFLLYFDTTLYFPIVTLSHEMFRTTYFLCLILLHMYRRIVLPTFIEHLKNKLLGNS
ncbi:hypothetical protein AGLY_000284 [Aphis glycines]|uniref:Uncharacterized protein n=1 Tax=Aphis glycines TaxID=307491 RepID=A0A6G0U8Y2_APHGL|nr:hypothetical protein AGLY_000284 [Aphis glycines]